MKVTKGDQYQKKVSFNIDPSCEKCIEGIKEIEDYIEECSKNHVYASMDMDTKKPLRKIIVSLDFNSHSILTHYHIHLEEEDGKNL